MLIAYSGDVGELLSAFLGVMARRGRARQSGRIRAPLSGRGAMMLMAGRQPPKRFRRDTGSACPRGMPFSRDRGRQCLGRRGRGMRGRRCRGAVRRLGAAIRRPRSLYAFASVTRAVLRHSVRRRHRAGVLRPKFACARQRHVASAGPERAGGPQPPEQLRGRGHQRHLRAILPRHERPPAFHIGARKQTAEREGRRSRRDSPYRSSTAIGPVYQQRPST